MGTTWGPDAKNHRKSASKDPTPGEPKGGHFGALFDTFSGTVFGTNFGTMFSYFVDSLGPEKVTIFIGGLFKNRLWHFLKKVPTMSSKMTPFWYPVEAKMTIFRIPKTMQKK